MNAVAEQPTTTAAEPPSDLVPPKSATRFWSIERFVAFLLGPAVVAGCGWLSTFLAREIGIHISAESMVVVFGAGALGAAGLAYKWLHGRQIEMQVNALGAALPEASRLLTPGAAVKDVSAVTTAPAAEPATIESPAVTEAGAAPTEPGAAPAGEADAPEPDVPAAATAAPAGGEGIEPVDDGILSTDIPPAVTDPAPPTPVGQAPPTAGEPPPADAGQSVPTPAPVADQGAASTK